jgi:hypothetical protein
MKIAVQLFQKSCRLTAMRNRHFGFAVGLALVPALFLSAATGRADVAVRPPVGNIDPAFLSSLNTALRQAVVDQGYALASPDKDAALFQATGPYASTPEAFAKAGRDCGVEIIVIPNVVDIGDALMIIIQVVHSGTEKSLLRSFSSTVQTTRELALDQASQMLKMQLPQKVKKPETGQSQPTAQFQIKTAAPSAPAPGLAEVGPLPKQPARLRAPVRTQLELSVTSTPPDALASIKGQRGWHPMPTKFLLDPGVYTAVVKKSGYSAVRAELSLDTKDAALHAALNPSYRGLGRTALIVAGIGSAIGTFVAVIKTDKYEVWIPIFAADLALVVGGIYALTRHTESTYTVERLTTP